MLSQASKYGIRAALYLSKNATKEERLGIKKIAEELEIHAPFLAKTLQILKKNEIITSVKGPKGGFYLSKSNKKKTLFDIINCIDDVSKFTQCFLGQIECSDKNPCVIHHLYSPFKEKLLIELKTKTIVEMANELDTNSTLSKIL